MTKQPAATAPVPPTRTVDATLEVSEAAQYGRKRYYAENETARIFLRLLKQDSLSPRDIELIKELGYRVLLRPRSVTPTEL